jgi:8-oxo-dGTP pyrophosphatase MutT (NUDIX family)
VDRDLIIERLRGRESRKGTDRGDHNLNPGLDDHYKLVPAAVLVPLIERKDGLTALLTQRTSHLAHHPGQVSFPGGHVDPGDESPEATALRETEEEVGLHRRHIDVLGRLDQYRVRTGFSVTPVVGLVMPPFDIKPDDFEVAEVFEVPLTFLMDPGNHERHSRDYRGETRYFYAIPYNGYYIWGATAGMLVNLYQVLTEP